jgi:hypothetical protein
MNLARGLCLHNQKRIGFSKINLWNQRKYFIK